MILTRVAVILGLVVWSVACAFWLVNDLKTRLTKPEPQPQRHLPRLPPMGSVPGYMEMMTPRGHRVVKKLKSDDNWFCLYCYHNYERPGDFDVFQGRCKRRGV